MINLEQKKREIEEACKKHGLNIKNIGHHKGREEWLYWEISNHVKIELSPPSDYELFDCKVFYKEIQDKTAEECVIFIKKELEETIKNLSDSIINQEEGDQTNWTPSEILNKILNDPSLKKYNIHIITYQGFLNDSIKSFKKRFNEILPFDKGYQVTHLNKDNQEVISRVVDIIPSYKVESYSFIIKTSRVYLGSIITEYLKLEDIISWNIN